MTPGSCTGIVRFLHSLFTHLFIHQTSMEYQLSIALSQMTPTFSSLNNNKQILSHFCGSGIQEQLS